MESVAKEKHPSLLGKLVGYEENEVLWIRPLVSNIRLGLECFTVTSTVAYYDKRRTADVKSITGLATW